MILRPFSTLAIPILLAIAWISGCDSESPVPPTVRESTASIAGELSVSESGSSEDSDLPVVATDDWVLDISDRATLDRIEDAESGYSWGDLLARIRPHSGNPESLSDLYDDSRVWRELANTWSTAIEAVGLRMDRDLVVEHADALQWTAGNVGRRFDVRWLRSDFASFMLIGIVNRLDRDDQVGGCGEIRLVYRLVYRQEREDGSVASSPMPLTINAKLRPSSEDCRSVVRSWASAPEDPTERADWLMAGPLSPDALEPSHFELNVQAVRLPSGVAWNFAGQAVYLLRADEILTNGDAVSVRALPLENTPDVTRIAADPALRRELVEWIDSHHHEIDRGLHLLPERFLATEALSWSTLGIHRVANKPFQALLSPDELRTPEPGDWVRGTEALLERLDNATCMGCHQAGSTAGFHFLGRGLDEVAGVTNRLQFAASPHARRDRQRRRDWLDAFGNGHTPDSFRPHSLAPLPNQQIDVNQTCMPEESAANVTTPWSCMDDDRQMECRAIAVDALVDFPLGQCVTTPEAPERLTAGLTCREGNLTSNIDLATHPFNGAADRDLFEVSSLYDLPEDRVFFEDRLNCRPTVIGVPLGRTYRRCTSEERTLTTVSSDNHVRSEICAVVGGSRFDSCVEGDFHTCLDGIVARGMVDSCHANSPCREDYICQQLPWQLDGLPTETGSELAEAGIGFCTPTYFLFQLRLDGHPVPQ